MSTQLALWEQQQRLDEIAHTLKKPPSAPPVMEEYVTQLVTSQYKAASEIVASQDRCREVLVEINSSIDNLTDVVDDIAMELGEIHALLDWGMREIVWHLQLENEQLKQIVEALNAPLDTQARELRRRAEDAYRSGWYKDALSDFLDAEARNRYDFTIHQSLGLIYLFHEKNLDKALEYFEKAAKYAAPKSETFHAQALYYRAEVRRLQGDLADAIRTSEESLSVCPTDPRRNPDNSAFNNLVRPDLAVDMPRIEYQLARLCALSGDTGRAIDCLRKAIMANPLYAVSCCSEADLIGIRSEVETLLQTIRDEQEQKTLAALATLKSRDSDLSVMNSLNKQQNAEANAVRQRLEVVAERRGYLDLLEGERCVKLIFRASYRALEERIKTLADSFKKDIQDFNDWVSKRNSAIAEIKCPEFNLFDGDTFGAGCGFILFALIIWGIVGLIAGSGLGGFVACCFLALIAYFTVSHYTKPRSQRDDIGADIARRSETMRGDMTRADNDIRQCEERLSEIRPLCSWRSNRQRLMMPAGGRLQVGRTYEGYISEVDSSCVTIMIIPPRGDRPAYVGRCHVSDFFPPVVPDSSGCLFFGGSSDLTNACKIGDVVAVRLTAENDRGLWFSHTVGLHELTAPRDLNWWQAEWEPVVDDESKTRTRQK